MPAVFLVGAEIAMNRNRVIAVFAVAWGAALLLSWFIYRQATKPTSRDVVRVVAAARELPVGRKLAAADLKLVEIARRDLPAGALAREAEALDRALLYSVAANELLLESKITPKQGGEGLTAIIEPGKRAMTVQVNETISVAGFVQPGAKVDVIFTRLLPNGDAASATILHNVPVLAYGRNLQRPAPGSAPATGAPAGQPTVTLLVDPEQAQKLALAVQRGKIQLALRNPLDNAEEETEASYSEVLGIEEPVKETKREEPKVVLPPPPPPKPKDPREGKIIVKVFRGAKETEEIF
jgi:pilus assembly protein CpaB